MSSKVAIAVSGLLFAEVIIIASLVIVRPIVGPGNDILKTPDRWLLVLTFLLVTLQTAFAVISMSLARRDPRRYEYVLLTVEFGSISQYFASDELNRMSKDEGWEVVQILGDAILVRKPLEETIWWIG